MGIMHTLSSTTPRDGKHDTPYIRPARLSDAPGIAAIQAEQMARAVQCALGSDLSAQTQALFDAGSFAAQWSAAIAQSRQPHSEYAVLVLRTEAELLGFAALAPAEQLNPLAAKSAYIITAFVVEQLEEQAVNGYPQREGKNAATTADAATAAPAIRENGASDSKNNAATSKNSAADNENGSVTSESNTSDSSNGTADSTSSSAALLSAVVETAHRYGATALYLWLFASDAAVPLAAAQGFKPVGVQQSFEVDGTAIRQHLWARSPLALL